MYHQSSDLDPARGVVRGVLLGVAMWAALILGAGQLAGQIVATIPMKHGEATSMMRNSSRESQQVTVALYFGNADTLYREVQALVSPSAFRLDVGEAQIIRLRLHETVAPNTVLRIMTCYTPTSADQDATGSDTQAVTRLVLRTCVNSKVLVQ